MTKNDNKPKEFNAHFPKARELSISVTEVKKTTYITRSGEAGQELLFRFDCPSFSGKTPLPSFTHVPPVYLMLKEGSSLLRVPLLSGELKLFFNDPGNYYYLPEEDMAIHKSVSSFVDPSHRVKATASNCYVRKSGLFIPAGSSFEEGKGHLPHIYKQSFRDRLSWIEFNEELLTKKERSAEYLRSVLELPGLLTF